MRVLLVISWLLAGLSLVTPLSFAAESDVDRLLDLLVKKGVLTQDDATTFRAELAVKKQEEKQPASVPEWLENVKIKGDVRVRYQWEKNKGEQDNSRARIRARLGVEGKVNNKLKAGIGIATGQAGDPRSRDITLGNSSSANTPGAGKDIILDYAYAQYTPLSWLALTAGKFQNNLWQPHDVFWKGDITPEGAGINLTSKFTSKLYFFVNELFFILKNDSRTDNRPFLNALQPGLTYALNDRINFKSAFTYYKFEFVKGAKKFSYSKSGSAPYTASGNSLRNNTYRYNYDAIQPSLEAAFKNLFGAWIPSVSLFGDYIYNVAHVQPETGESGYDIGLKFGYDKVNDWSQWQAKLVYSKLGRDAWLDIFTDNNRYGGTTNSRTYEAMLEYGLGKNTSLCLDYYWSKSLTSAARIGRAPEQAVQVDWNTKF
jgi:polyhydroxyalkanoate synthesis regulator phasin